MVGGVHCNFYPESSLADFGADLAAYGESEETILEILERGARRDFTGMRPSPRRGRHTLERRSLPDVRRPCRR